MIEYQTGINAGQMKAINSTHIGTNHKLRINEPLIYQKETLEKREKDTTITNDYIDHINNTLNHRSSFVSAEQRIKLEP